MEVEVVAAFIILSSAVQLSSPTQTPPTQPVPKADAIKAYFGCIRAQSEQWLGNPAPPTHVDAVMAACAPSLKPAAIELASDARAVPNEAKMLDAYKAKHGVELDLTSAIEQRMHDQARAGALQILAGYPDKVKVNLSVHFDSDGIKP